MFWFRFRYKQKIHCSLFCIYVYVCDWFSSNKIILEDFFHWIIYFVFFRIPKFPFLSYSSLFFFCFCFDTTEWPILTTYFFDFFFFIFRFHTKQRISLEKKIHQYKKFSTMSNKRTKKKWNFIFRMKQNEIKRKKYIQNV